MRIWQIQFNDSIFFSNFYLRMRLWKHMLQWSFFFFALQALWPPRSTCLHWKLLRENILMSCFDALWATWVRSVAVVSLGYVVAPLSHEQGERWGDYDHMKPRSHSALGWQALSSFSSSFPKIPSSSKVKESWLAEIPVKWLSGNITVFNIHNVHVKYRYLL